MKQAKNVQVGAIVQFPHHCFAPNRSGWNGWIFRAAIVDRFYMSTTGKLCAEVTYCTKTASKYQLLPNTEAKAKVLVSNLFEYDVNFYRKKYMEFKSYEDAGEQVCWDQDTALLVNHGIF